MLMVLTRIWICMLSVFFKIKTVFTLITKFFFILNKNYNLWQLLPHHRKWGEKNPRNRIEIDIKK